MRRKGNIRRTAFKDPKKFFIISMEGKETEPRYFEEFKTPRESNIQIKLVPNPNHKSKPKEVLKRLHDYFRRNALREGDEGWIVIDRDAWEENELTQVCQDADKAGYKVAVSNPCFELWLYLHLHDNRPFNDRHDCQRGLAQVLSNYLPDKKGSFDVDQLLPGVANAIRRALRLDTEPHLPWPRNQGSRVYQLVALLCNPSN
jgi:hypothetical protein